MASLYKIPVKMLDDLMAPLLIERAIKEGAKARGLTLAALDAGTLEDILKREVFRRLQYSVPAPLAKRRVIEVLKEVHAAPVEDDPLLVTSGVPQDEQLAALEKSAKRFSLYFDWPESQRLRGILSTARTEEAEGRNIESLLQEGQDLLTQLERRLQEGLVMQGQDLAELKASFGRVQSMGGRDVRRLENLIAQIDEAQKQSTLLPGEVERARNITFKLRKSLESSVMQGTPDAPGMLDAEAQARVLALEQEHAERLLGDLGRDFAALFRARPDLQTQQEDYGRRLGEGQVPVEEIEQWRSMLETARGETLERQRQELAALEQKISELPQNGAAHDLKVALNVAQMTLTGGSLATDELRELQNSVRAMQHSPEMAARIMEHQRELAELERSAREIAGAEEALRVQIADARSALVRGQDVDLSSLWIELQQFMGEAAQQREDFDARADHVIEEYDQVRSLAGETIQRLGRLADALRAQRRLGTMSAQAREKYAQTLTSAEALLSEARAEYQAAQEVTSTFGEDALSDLLDVFDLGGDMGGDSLGGDSVGGDSVGGDSLSSHKGTPGAAPSVGSDPFAGLGAAAPATPPAPAAGGIFDSLMGGVAPAPAPAVSAPAPAASAAPQSLGKPNRWLVTDGLIAAGDADDDLRAMATMLGQADRLGLTRLDMGDSGYIWSARQIELGQWRLARARNWDDLEEEAGKWLDYGQD